MGLSRAAENYLVTIYLLQKDKSNVRSIDIVKALNYSRPTISIAMRKLRDHNAVEMDEQGVISLTPQGKKLAQKVHKRRIALKTFLVNNGVSEDVAHEDAARIEYDLSDESYHAIVSTVME